MAREGSLEGVEVSFLRDDNADGKLGNEGCQSSTQKHFTPGGAALHKTGAGSVWSKSGSDDDSDNEEQTDVLDSDLDDKRQQSRNYTQFVTPPMKYPRPSGGGGSQLHRKRTPCAEDELNTDHEEVNLAPNFQTTSEVFTGEYWGLAISGIWQYHDTVTQAYCALHSQFA
ncbi:hypothetical protein BDQ12DRAFT_672099 [Crucibulum laeve]|uniref:Uncharacterized protein n=1 Tax=Crucibulum laeve TaxID=68775 RepID=A0A5C3LE80_9AGAR|nr:hypothetical protein BDQ12DRAFT_672099 [Crucibulum laeve]